MGAGFFMFEARTAVAEIGGKAKVGFGVVEQGKQTFA